MKRILFILLLFISTIAFSQINLNSGLVAYYPFNGNANDVSGNGNNSVFNNATLTNDNLGNANSAYHFNGTDTYMKIPNSPSLNMANKMSIALKVRPLDFYTGPCYNNMMIMKGDEDYLPGIYFIRFSDVYTGCIAPTTANERFYGTGVIAENPIVQLDQWYNVVWTCDGTTAKLYVNCELKASAPANGMTFTSDFDLYIGKMNHPNFPYWLNGDLDEIRIYDRALNEEEVTALCIVNVPVDSCDTWLATPSTSSYVTVGDVDVTGNKLTVEASFNRSSAFDNTITFGKLVSKHTDATNVNYSLLPVQCEITTDVTGYVVTPQACLPDLDKTFHVAMVYDGATLKFYRNGFLLSQRPCTGNLINNDLWTTIGQIAGNGYPDLTQFKGYINEVRIWNVAKSQAELGTYMNTSLPSPATQPGLVAYYTFNDLVNKQGNPAYNGSLTGSATINATNPNCTFIADSCAVPTSSTIINDYTEVIDLDICKNELVVSDAAKYNPGDTVLIIQMKGVIIDSSNTATFGNISNYKNSGNYEMNIVKQKSGNTLSLLNVLQRQYDIPTGKVQLIRVPYYKSITTTNTLTCLPWDGSKGGVLVLNARDTISLNADIDVSGKGFKGGTGYNSMATALNCFQNNYNYPITSNADAGVKGESITFVSSDIICGKGSPAGGGGGGLGHNSGGGGGGNGGTGGFGGYQLEPCGSSPFDNRGIGGNALTYNTTANKIFMGSGGGAGQADNTGNLPPDGGNGAGIIIVLSNYLKSNSFKILSNGDNATACSMPASSDCHDGMGGGGAGGSVLLSINQFIDNAIVENQGGKGADMVGSVPLGGRIGAGGGGGGGLLFIKNNSLPANLTNTSNGGANGVLTTDGNNSWGATPGQNGIKLFNLTIPVDSVFFQKNIDSVRIKDSLTACNLYDFKGFAYTNGNAINTWQWNFGDTTTGTTQNTSHTYLASGTYNVNLVVTDVNGCKDSVAVPVLPSIIDITKGNDTSICEGSSAQLLASGGSTYSWTPTSTLDNPNISNPVATPNDTTVYHVTVTNAFGCSNTDSMKVSVNNLPVITTSNDTTICINSSVQVSASGGSTYLWTPVSSLDNGNISNPVATPTDTTVYHVTVTNALGCLNTDSIKVSVNNLPIVTTSNDTAICANNSIQLSVSGGSTYLWIPASSLDNSNISNPVATPTVTTTYHITITNAFGCSNTDSIKVFINPLPAISISNDTSVCNNTPVQLFASGGSSYSWTPTSTLNNSDISNPVATPSATTTYQVIVTDLAGCSNKDSVKIVASPLPVISKSNDTSICNNTGVQLFVAGGSTYSWAPSSGLSNPNISNPVATPLTTTTYIVTVINNPGCFKKDSVKVSVYPASIIRTSNDTLVCGNTSTQIFATGGNSYIWSPAALLSNPNISDPVASPSSTTTFFVSITDGNSCKYADSVTLTIKPAPVFTVSPDQSVCLRTPAQLSASGGDSYFWQPANSLSNGNINNPIATPDVTTIYTVKIKEVVCNDSAMLYTRLDVTPLPVVSATKSNDVDCSSGFSQLTASGAQQYVWQPSASLNNNTIANPVATPNATTLYVVNGIHNNGCVDSDTITVFVDFNDKNALYLMPNSFTPNADGFNDCYGLKYWGNIVELDFDIYNRFGEKVFHTTNPLSCWDGRYKGEMQNIGAFVFTIKAKTSCGTISKKGTFILLK